MGKIKWEVPMLHNPERITKELINWIRSYFEKTGKNCCAVIGISGGKDSSVAAALCANALGPKRVVGVLMPNGEQSDIEDARLLVRHLDIPFLEVDILPTVTQLKKSLFYNPEFEKISGQSQVSLDTEINLPPRIRMATLYAIAQSLPYGGRVVNTCNRSEDYVGYSTKYGDAAGDFSPLSNFLVHEVKQIGSVLKLPDRLIEKIPTDGLSGQSDEKKLGFSYDTLDHYILSGICADPVIKAKIDFLHNQNLHKLRPMASFQYSEIE